MKYCWKELRWRLAKFFASDQINSEIHLARCDGFDSGLDQGLHTMHERYLKGEDCGISYIEHLAWRSREDMKKHVAQSLFSRQVDCCNAKLGGFQYRIGSADEADE